MSILSRGRRSGAALMLSLWALFLLSAMIISWALDIDSHLVVGGQANRILEAEAMACSGAEIALHPSIKPGSPNLRRQVNVRESYEARLTGEGGRLNLNYIATIILTGDVRQQELFRGVLRTYLYGKGIDLIESDRMIDNLLDWVQQNIGLHHLNSDPETEDYHPAHGLLRRVDELNKVKGWKEFTSEPGWDNDFTVSSTPMQIDLAWASRDVLLALPGVTETMVDNFLQKRRGPDGLDGTQDDTQFQNVDEAGAALGFTAPQFKVLKDAGLVTVNSGVFRVVSVGKSGETTRVVQMVFQKTKTPGALPQLITWKEL